MNKTNTEWKESDLVVEQMIKGSTGALWGKRLEEADHFPVLKKAIDSVGNFGTLLDIGCGAGDVSRVWKGKYIGSDLPWVVERVSKKCNPAHEYFPIDLNTSTIQSLPSARVILMNGFLDVRDNPHEIFESLLKMNYENFIVHRQRLSQDSFKIEYLNSYGGTIVPNSIMSWNRINESVMQHDSKSKIYLIEWQGDSYTIIVSR